MPYWQDRTAAGRTVIPDARRHRSQYLAGVPDPETVNPDLWELDQRYLDMPGRDQVMLDMLYDIQTTVGSYPEWQQCLREITPPTLIAWGKTTRSFFTADGARAYLDDVPAAELYLLDTGHFATAPHHEDIAALMRGFLSQLPVAGR